jgi:hypothetical protein
MTQTTNSNVQNGARRAPSRSFGHWIIAVSDLFRISRFGFRIWIGRHVKITGPKAFFTVTLASLVLLGGAAVHAGDPPADTAAVRRNAQELWRSSIAPPPSAPASADLDKTASELQALAESPQHPRPAGPAKPAPAPAPEVFQMPSAQTQPAAPAALDANTIQRLKLAPPTGRAGIVALADSLFAHDQLEGAAALYQEALVQDKAGRDKDWLLFQIGNCLRDKDAPAARGFYQRVSAECPGSAWAMIAATQRKYLDRQQEPTTRPAAAKGAGEARGRGAPPASLGASPSTTLGTSSATPLGTSRTIASVPPGDANAR